MAEIPMKRSTDKTKISRFYKRRWRRRFRRKMDPGIWKMEMQVKSTWSMYATPRYVKILEQKGQGMKEYDPMFVARFRNLTNMTQDKWRQIFTQPNIRIHPAERSWRFRWNIHEIIDQRKTKSTTFIIKFNTTLLRRVAVTSFRFPGRDRRWKGLSNNI